MAEVDVRCERNYVLLTGPMGGVADPRFPSRPLHKWLIPWTPECSKLAVMRFLDEAKYYLNIYNIVVQHFVRVLPFEKYLALDSDEVGVKEKQYSYDQVQGNAKYLNVLLGCHADEGGVTSPEEKDHELIDLEVENTFQALRELIASLSSVHDSENVTEVSLEELLKSGTSCGPSLISRLKERFEKLVNDEVAKLRDKLNDTLPQYAEKHVDKLCKLLSKTMAYSDYILKVENFIVRGVNWSHWSHVSQCLDFRHTNSMKVANHVIYAPKYVIENLEDIFFRAYWLRKKMKQLEKVLLKKDPAVHAKLQEEKDKIQIPTEHNHFLEPQE